MNYWINKICNNYWNKTFLNVKNWMKKKHEISVMWRKNTILIKLNEIIFKKLLLSWFLICLSFF